MDIERQQQLRSHARILAIFHYVMGGLFILMSTFFLLYVLFAVGIIFAELPRSGSNGPPVWLMGSLFAGIGCGGGLIFIGIGVANLMAGFALTGMRNTTLIMIVSVINMLNQPLGLVLGILTLLYIMQADAKRLFEADDDDELLQGS